MMISIKRPRISSISENSLRLLNTKKPVTNVLSVFYSQNELNSKKIEFNRNGIAEVEIDEDSNSSSNRSDNVSESFCNRS